MKKNYVISVSGAPGPCYLSAPSDEGNSGALVTTADIDLAVKFTDFTLARNELRRCVKAFPLRSFKLDVEPAN
jgi:hypothetical protein